MPWRQRAAFTLVELLAMILILTAIITITSLLLRETRMTSARLSENEEASHTASRAMELIRHDVERSIADYSMDFVCAETDIAGPGTNVPAVPVSGKAAQLSMLVLNESSAGSSRALSAVHYRLVAGTDSAYPSLVRAERTLDNAQLQAIRSNPNWPDDTTNLTNEVVASYVTDFSIRCSGSDLTVANDWSSSELPVCVDVYIEYLPESAARRLNGRNALTNLVEIERNVTKTSTRIFPPNRRGYMDGK